ncbi:hypothetical protein PVAND_014143 [Polypedilum vanderplanki]|uniref:Uncharacterized protein n=1 Tax=Polypedilum vanderplanki TaxID=319348 RepID=A0A9J6CSS9_POLVA|nr:hypothetical protein PVAND_014143 [Polypedilum vanderplanki]
MHSNQEAINSKTKPIFVESSLMAVRNVINNLQLNAKPLLKLAGKKVQVICSNQVDKIKILEKLKSQQFRFHSFTENHNKLRVVLLKGFYLDNNSDEKTQLDELKQLLVNKGLKVNSVRIFFKKEDYTIFSIGLQDNISLKELNYHYKDVDSIIVRWEAINREKIIKSIEE